jgi:hypothetical protein
MTDDIPRGRFSRGRGRGRGRGFGRMGGGNWRGITLFVK